MSIKLTYNNNIITSKQGKTTIVPYTQDYLFDRQVTIYQPQDGYRASTDAVMLSSLIKDVKPEHTILDVGSGTGAISLCLASRFADIKPRITGLELQPELAELSNLSARANHFSEFLHYRNQDIRSKISDLSNCSFDHVITNPPYAEKDMPSPKQGKSLAHNHHDFSLHEWLDFCIKMLKPKGKLYTINRAEALDEILSTIHHRLGHIIVIPLFSKSGQTAKRIMICAQKDNHTPTRILSGLTLHQNDGTYTAPAQQILRDAACFWSII